ncbi:MAG: T9SS type A sorting domain-containing protein [Crocinitomicaceae bacterium]
MKTLYTILLFTGLTLSVNAQNFNYAPSQSVHTELTTSSYSDVNIDITTQTTQAIDYKWELISNTMPTGWVYSLCDYTSCYPGIPATGTMTPISLTDAQNGTIGFFKLTINPDEVEGSGEAKIYVYDAADYNNGDTVTMSFNHTSSLGIEDEVYGHLSVYPNPAVDVLTLDNSMNISNNVVVSNVLGEQVMNLTIAPNSKETIDVASFKPGIYFVSYTNKEGIRRTEKIIKR